jgi:hypothetical protein
MAHTQKISLSVLSEFYESITKSAKMALDPMSPVVSPPVAHPFPTVGGDGTVYDEDRDD